MSINKKNKGNLAKKKFSDFLKIKPMDRPTLLKYFENFISVLVQTKNALKPNDMNTLFH